MAVSHAPATLATLGTVLRARMLTSAQPTLITATPRQLVVTPTVASLVLATPAIQEGLALL